MKCVTFHLQQVFRHEMGEALKYYIINLLKKPYWIPIHQFLVQVEQLNCYLKTLPCLYYSPSVNQATKQVLPLDDADLMTHLLCMCPAKWQTIRTWRRKQFQSILGPCYCYWFLRKSRTMRKWRLSLPVWLNQKGLKASARWSILTPASPKSLNK
jgi:hypothetical protein